MSETETKEQEPTPEELRRQPRQPKEFDPNETQAPGQEAPEKDHGQPSPEPQSDEEKP